MTATHSPTVGETSRRSGSSRRICALGWEARDWSGCWAVKPEGVPARLTSVIVASGDVRVVGPRPPATISLVSGHVPRWTPKSGHSWTPENRPFRIAPRDVDAGREPRVPARHEQRLGGRQTTAGPAAGTPRLVAAADRAGDRGPARDGQRLPEGRWPDGTGPWPATRSSGKAGHFVGGVHRPFAGTRGRHGHG